MCVELQADTLVSQSVLRILSGHHPRIFDIDQQITPPQGDPDHDRAPDRGIGILDAVMDGVLDEVLEDHRRDGEWGCAGIHVDPEFQPLLKAHFLKIEVGKNGFEFLADRNQEA